MKPVKKRIKLLLLFVIFCFNSFLCMSQDLIDVGYRGELMRWNQFPLDSIWQFNSTNDTDIGKLISNNEGWQLVNTEFLPDVNGHPANWKGISWFRKKFDVPVTWRGKPVALRMGHYGASEIYLDGKLVIRYGVVANTIEKEKIYVSRKPIIIQLDSQLSHTFLVHYSNQRANSQGYFSKFGFRLLLASSDTTFRIGVTEVPSLPVTIGILFIFSLFFLFVYFFDTKRLASLLTALMLLCFCSLFIANFLLITWQERDQLIRAANWVQILALWTQCLQALVLYALYYDGKMPRRSWFVAVIMLLCLSAFWTPLLFSKISGILLWLVLFEIFRILISGVLKKKTGFWILLIGAIIQQTGYFVFVADIFHLFPIMTRTQEILLMIFPQMGVPLTYALHLAWEFGKANQDLRLQVVQVNELSEKTLKQEQEKQEILTQQKDKLEVMVDDRTKQLSQQKETLQNTLTNLTATQAQLIQSEKMASLGELTAGIAHEIQNPLNFVNNFSEVNKELVDELQQELKAGKIDGAIIISNDIKANEEKINHHGKRADAIVKGMLQHSGRGNGVKEPTDINKLTDEYLRLSYHGLRSKDKSFNATIKTDFDNSIGNISIIPQDIGRVILNLINNAFYAVQQKQKEGPSPEMTSFEKIPSLYEPTVSVSTKKNDNKIFISVKDNGNGIPQKILDKIFQPFFTTKPTGQGTGLGLSLSYDIVKAHGGEIKVETTDGEGSEFCIELPVTGIFK